MTGLITRLREFKNARIVMDTGAEELCKEAADVINTLQNLNQSNLDSIRRLRGGLERIEMHGSGVAVKIARETLQEDDEK